MLFKRINVISTLRGNFVSSVCPIQTIQRAKTRHKNKNKSKNEFDASSQNTKGTKERERENKTNAAVILPTILFVSQRGKFL